MEFYCLIVVIFALFPHANAFSFGAPPSTCFTQHPKHNNQGTQTSASPYSLKFTPEKYQPAGEVTVEVVIPNGKFLKGIQTAARRTTGNSQEIVGRFLEYPEDDMKSYNCFNGYQNMVTHKNNKDKSSLIMKWKAPDDNVGDVFFLTTFVMQFDTFWHKVESLLPVDSTLPVKNAKYPAASLSSLTEPIDFDGCGKSMGCYLYPRHCSNNDCLGAATYKYRPNTNDFLFELHTKQHDYISIGFSHDKHMKDDATISCTRMGIQEGYNPGHHNKRLMNFYSTNHEVKYIDGYLQCRFVVPQTLILNSMHPKKNQSRFSEFKLQQEWFLLLAWGDTMPESDVMAHHHDLPPVTNSKVNLLEHRIVYGSIFKRSIAAHGILMMVSWMFLAGIVTVVARHYKKWLPNRTFLNTAIWFHIHRNTAILVFLLTAIGFIIIFVHFNKAKLTKFGYTHACFGIATMTAVCLQVLAGMLRPNGESKFRPAFNLGHWVLGHATHFLSCVAIFLAFNIQYINSDLRSKAFTVLVMWVILQVIGHILFEVRSRWINSKEPPLNQKTPIDSILLCVYSVILLILCMIVAIITFRNY